MMIAPAERLIDTKEYYFSLKLKEIAKMRQQGTDVINLGIGSPDLAPSQATIDALIQSAKNPKSHGYQTYQGILEFRKAFADKYKSLYNVDLNPDNEILPLLGSKEGIMHTSLTFINPGDEVLVPNPGYPTYSSVARLVGGKVRYYDLLEKNNWYPDWQALENQDLSNVKVMWLNYPNMPTGAPATHAVFENAIKLAHKYKFLIVHDNPYSSILNHNQLSILTYAGGKEVALELNSMSKSHNMAGWRVGLVVGHHEYIQSILKVKSNIDSGTFLPIQHASVAACHNSAEWHTEQNAIYSRRRDIIWQILDHIGAAYDHGQVGMFVWARIPKKYKNSEELTEHYLQKCHVFITPGFIFGSNGEGYLRVSVCSEEAQFTEALKRIKERG
ncbi:MAG: aminotransferase class I/II-fold pyridoxal phosphate-dependent enzyme [Cytophagales bacterium]|nr:aminotransferase class I/II-fold pyridoxal phosphate-dependent enzyme [Cytophagales bacterium]